jgi:ubiquinone/menaquinone biosynthesis C-methylase UbiE
MNQPSNIAFIGSIPEKYDRYLGPLFFEPYAQDIITRIDPKPVRAVLEIACGTGRVTRHLINHFPAPVEIIATDLNADMLSIAKTINTDKRVDWEVADAQNLQFEDGRFDLVICQFGFMFVPDKAKAFSEAWRVLAPGGCLLFNFWDKLERNPLSSLGNKTVNEFFPEKPPIFLQIPFSLYDEKLVHTMLKEAGFQDIDIQLVVKEGTSPSAKDAATGLIKGSPLFGFINQKNPALPDSMVEAVEKQFAKAFGTSPLKHTMQAWVCKTLK